MPNKTALIIGAGPAGLTAALELQKHTGIKPIVLEGSREVGGISKTVVHNGNRMDIGGHRFFSKSDWVMKWWQDILPIERAADVEGAVEITYQNKKRTVEPSDAPNGAADPDKRMLIRSRLSRIYFLRRFFDYPIKLNLQTIRNLGPLRLLKIGVSYLYISLFPRKQERSLEDFIVNRFGRELYLTFFKDYTEKVWGVPCDKISPEWGAQRIKGLSIGKALLHAAKKVLSPSAGGMGQKETQTSLIERFLYPKLGPGQMWQEAAEKMKSAGGEIRFNHRVTGFSMENGKAVSVSGVNEETGEPFCLPCDYLFSTMPVRDLVAGMSPAPHPEVMRVANGLQYRDFLTVGLLVKKMKPHQHSGLASESPPDNWIYIQEKDVRLGRLQVFNNWSPYLVKDPSTVWLGLEYFCNEGDDLWKMADGDLTRFGAAELAKIGLIDEEDTLDGTVVRMPKAYPAYFGTYDEFSVIKNCIDAIENLFLIGRNGMHRYNNQDHSMLTAKLAVENIVNGVKSKRNIWGVNIDDEYHEETR